MKKAIITVLVISILFVTARTFISTFFVKKQYYYSPDKDRMVTRLEYVPYLLRQSTYFIQGQYDGIMPPSTYIKPVYSGRDGGFVLLMHWTDTSCIFYFPHGLYESNGLGSEFQLKKLNEDSQQWREMVADTLNGNNKVLTEYNF